MDQLDVLPDAEMNKGFGGSRNYLVLVLGLLLSVVEEKAKGTELEVVESVLHRVGRFSLGLGESQFSHPSSSRSLIGDVRR